MFLVKCKHNLFSAVGTRSGENNFENSHVDTTARGHGPVALNSHWCGNSFAVHFKKLKVNVNDKSVFCLGG